MPAQSVANKSTPAVRPPDPLESAYRYGEAKSRQDIQAALSHCQDDFEIVCPPLRSHTRGSAAVENDLVRFFEAFPDYTFEREGGARAADGSVVLFGRFRATFSGRLPAGPLRALPRALTLPRRVVDLPAVAVFETRGGLLQREVFRFDAPTLARQCLGAPRDRPGSRGEHATRRPDAAAPAPRPDVFVERFASYWARPTAARMAELLSPEVVLSQPLVPETRGLARGQAEFAKLFALTPDLHAQVDRSWPWDDGVVIEFCLRGTLHGRPFEIPAVDVIRLRGAMAERRDSYFDSLPLLLSLLGRPTAWWSFWRSGAARFWHRAET